MENRIKIFDTTLRDGEQSPGAAMSIEQKVKMAVMLERMGVDRIEAGFPVSSPIQYEAVERIGKTIRNSTVVGLARAVEGDIDAVDRALNECENRMLHLFIATSPLHRMFKLKMSKLEILRKLKETLQYAAERFDEIEFSAEDASRTEPAFLVEVVRTAIDNGATTINIPDTVGYATPEEFGDLIRRLRDDIPQLERRVLSVHCHNDLGLAVANSLSAVKNGANQVEVTLNGIGERAGNCSLEELVMILNVRRDVLGFYTDIDESCLYPASKLLQNITGLMVPRNKPLFGENAFSHESGIHQHGVLENKATYEIIKPTDIGRGEETLVMGRHSGKHAFAAKLRKLGLELDEKQFNQGFERFIALADRKKEVYDEDIIDIVSNLLGQAHPGYQIEYFNSTTGNHTIPMGTVKLKLGDESFIASAHGDGPVDALYKSIDAAIGRESVLKEYQLQAIGPFKDAIGQVRIVVERDGQCFTGRGSSTDIIEASILAYLNAINCDLFYNSSEASEKPSLSASPIQRKKGGMNEKNANADHG